jgi:hypothetical protein
MKKNPSTEHLEKAKLLTKEEAEHLLARMKGKLNRRIEDRKMDPLEAVAIQLELEDERLAEWRARWAEISARENKKREK